MVRNQDEENFKQLLQTMQPRELLAYFSSVIPDSVERFRIQNELRSATPEQRAPIKQRLEILTLVEGIPREVEIFYTELLFATASYVVEGYEQHEFKPEYTKQVIEIIQKNRYFQGFPNSVNLLRELTGGPYATFKWSWFNRHPDTKDAFSTDDERKYLLFYCLNGIAALAQQSEIGALPLVDLQANLLRLKQICEQIAESAPTWQLILGINAQKIVQLSNDFVKVNQRISGEWQTARENRVIAANLDPEKIIFFTNKVISTIEAAQGLRPLLRQHGRFNIVSSIPGIFGKSMWGINIWNPDKVDFTALSGSINLIEDLGVNLGAQMVQIEKDNLIHMCIRFSRSLRTRKEWATLEPYFAAALAKFHHGGYQAGVILVPHSLRYELFQELPSFTNPSSKPDSIPGLRGYYQGIPILNWYFSEAKPLLLFWDISKAFQLDIQEPAIEVKPLSATERAKIHKRDPQVEERKLQLSVGIKVAEKAQITWLDKHAILKLQLKLHKSGFFKIGPLGIDRDNSGVD